MIVLWAGFETRHSIGPTHVQSKKFMAYLIHNGLLRACRSSTDRPGIDNKGVFVLYCQVGYEFPARGSKISLILSIEWRTSMILLYKVEIILEQK